MADPIVEASSLKSLITVVVAASTTIKRGELVAHNGTNTVKANATDDTLNPIGIAVSDGGAGDTITIALDGVLTDSDAPFTAGAPVYPSAATAGAITSTRPTTITNHVDIIGWAVSSSRVVFSIAPKVRLESSHVFTARGLEVGNPAAYGTTQGTNGIVMATGTAPAGTIVTSSGLFSSSTVVRKIIADGTVSNVET